MPFKLPYILQSNPHRWEDDGEDKDDREWVTDKVQLWVMTASLMNNTL